MKFNFLHKLRWNSAGQFAHMIYGVLLITLIVSYFGPENYTYYVYFQTILASALLVEFGVTSRILSLEKKVLENKVNRFFNAYYVTIILLAGLSIISLSLYFLPHDDARYKFTIIITLLVLLNYTRSLVRAFLLRFHRDEIFNKVYIGFDFLRLFICFLSVYFELLSSVLELLLLLTAITFFEIVIHFRSIERKARSFKFQGVGALAECVASNGLFYFYSLLSVAIFQIPYWLLPLIESSESVALYALAVLPASLLMTAFYPITSSLLPFLRDSGAQQVFKKKLKYLVSLSVFLVFVYCVFLQFNGLAYKVWLGNAYDERVVALSDGLFLFGLVSVVQSLYTIYLLSQEKVLQIVVALSFSIVSYYFFLLLVAGGSLEKLAGTLFILPLIVVLGLASVSARRANLA